LSGPEAITLAEKVFVPATAKKKLESQKNQSLHFGKIVLQEEEVDEVLLSLFRAPHSFTGEDTVELSCHGSPYILQRIIQGLLQAGARMAEPGEYTLKAFYNGKMDLSQAEAVADLIASESKLAHQMAMNQMKGGFSKELAIMREELINFAALIELELDFSEEDVEFADRTRLFLLIDQLKSKLHELITSFEMGNVIKNGIATAIIGAPNAGKSTLLNALLGEEKAIVSDIAGTTRDSIEDVITIEGIQFRFIDTAGLRETEDVIEKIGIERAYQKIKQAQLLLYLVDAQQQQEEEAQKTWNQLCAEYPDKNILALANKTETAKGFHEPFINISAKEGLGLNILKNKLIELSGLGKLSAHTTLVSNQRHVHALQQALAALIEVEEGLQNHVPGDLVAIDLRRALHFLGSITGAIEVDRDILGAIFSKFCIGK
jgi:tRNA modification GTPase